MHASNGRLTILRRGAVTAGAVAVFLAGERIPLPGLEAEFFRSISAEGPPFHLALLALGVTPLVSAFVFVELAAAVLPRLRAMRLGSARDRRPLTAAAWALAAALAAWQGWGLAVHLQRLTDRHGYPLVEPRVGPALAVAAIHLLGVLALGGLATLVTRRGIGNGFAVLLAVAATERLLRVGRLALRQPRETWGDTVLLLGIALVVVVPLIVAKVRRRGPSPGALVPVPTCGLVVITAPSLVLAFAPRLADWFPSLGPVAEALEAESWWGTFGDLALTAALALLFARAFCPPGAVAQAFARAAPSEKDEGAVHRALAAANRRSFVLVMGVALVPTAAALLEVPVDVQGRTLFDLAVVIAVALDLEAEVKARHRGGALATAWATHHVYAVHPALRALADAGIAGVVRGRYFRSLFHFFAPYAPIEVLVPPERAAEAEAVCARVVAEVG